MKKIKLCVRGAAVAACASLLCVAVVSCDDTSDIGDTDSSTPLDGSTPRDSSPHEAASMDTSAADSPGLDAGDSSSDSAAMDSPVTMEAEAAAAPELDLCPTFDTIFGILPDAGEPVSCATQTNGTCPDRSDSWIDGIIDAFAGGPAVSDCNINAVFMPTENGGLLTDAQFDDYVANQLEAYTLSFLGCPLSAGDAGVEAGAPLPSFGLIPAGISGNVFTSADLTLLSTYWSQAIQAAVVTAGGSLTLGQIAAINAQLAYEASVEPAVVHSSAYNYSTCSDGGVDAGGP